MRDLDELRELTGRIRQPSLDAIVSTARRRRRRAVLTVAAVGAAFAVLARAGGLLTDAYDRSAPPVDEPTPGQMAPERIVTGGSSLLVTAGASLDDPDVRISLWEAECEGCGEPEGTPSMRSALALTTDGFASTTYVAWPVAGDNAPRLVGVPYGPRIESPAANLFLVADDHRAGEWLVRTDGTVRPVQRVETPLAPSDPRLWFRCFPTDPPAAWNEAISPLNPADEFPWCALDPEAATAYEWPARWNGSVPLPVSDDEPWGLDTRVQPTFGWWEVAGQRYRCFLGGSVEEARGAVGNPPTGGPLFFTRMGLEPTLDLLVPREGPGVKVVTRAAPSIAATAQSAGRPSGHFDVMTGTPDGALLAVRTYGETAIWRAGGLTDGDFELVHDPSTTADPDPGPGQLAWLHEPTIVGDRIQVMTRDGVLVSDDDGRTWTEVTRWR